MNKKDREYSELFTSYYPLIYSTVCFKINDRDDADDITQSVFLKFYQKMDEIVNVRKWLFGTMRLEVMNYYRTSKNSETDVDSIFQDAALTFVNGFRDTRVIIEEAIEGIEDEKDRIIFDLVAVQNYTYQETAELIGVTTRKVKYRYHLIVRAIVNYLNTRGIKNIEDLL